MALINVSNLSMEFGERLLFDKMNFEINESDRIGLIGINGCGKTTLFKLLTGEYSQSDGNIIIGKNTSIGYMEQHVCRNLERSAYDEVMTVFSYLTDMESELDILNAKINAYSGKDSIERDKLIERQVFLNDEFTKNGGLTCRSRARAALLALGFDDEKMNLPIKALSGGQRAKLQLTKLLLCNANFLLLDEPTNHLDAQAIEWLEQFLAESKRSYMVISHDRYFLDQITNKTFELENKKMTVYKGNYSEYLPQKEMHDLTLQREYENTVKEINRLEGIVEQQRRWNREKNIRTAESKQKMINKLTENLVRPESAPESMQFEFKTEKKSGEDVLMVDNLSLAFDENTIFENISMEIHRGERIFILGPNGCGKTSLLKTILGLYKAKNGRIRFGTEVKVGYYDQIQTGMDSHKTVFEELSDTFPSMTNTEIRSTLAKFLFKNDDVFKELSDLSGGERAKVLLTELMLGGANLLILDEPTNHLDINSCEALQNAVKNYDGTVLAVSHDRYLINDLADRIFYLTPQGIEVFDGNYDDFVKKYDPFAKVEKIKEHHTSGQTEYKNKKQNDAKRRKAKARLSKLELEISEQEDLISQLNNSLNDPENSCDYEKMLGITSEIDAANHLLDAMYEEWEELSEFLSE